MKKLLFVITVLLISQISFGQLKVNENGTVFMGNLPPFTGGFLNIGSTSKVGLDIRPEIATAWGDVVRVTLKKNGIGAFVVRNRNFLNTGGMSTDIVFEVKGNGDVVTRGKYLTPTVPATLINNNRSFHSFGSTVNRLKQLNAVRYQPQEEQDMLKSSSMDSISEPLSELEQQINEENKRDRIGFLTQELENLFPELLYTLPSGEKVVAYSELIPLLVEAIKEQQSKLESLETLLSKSTEGKSIEPKSGISQKMNNTALYQNTPNPFNQETEIRYQVPSDAFASICIYNLSGQQLKKYPLTDINGKIVVSASELAAGIYIYSLIVDNQEVDSKRMVLTD